MAHYVNNIPLFRKSLHNVHGFSLLFLNGTHEQVKLTAQLLYVSDSEAQCLLKFYRWKNKKLEEEWFLNSGQVRDKAGLTVEVVTQDSTAVGTKRRKPLSKKVQCQSAFCERVPIESASALACGHWFCHSCWKGFLDSQVRAGSKSIHATCPGMR